MVFNKSDIGYKMEKFDKQEEVEVDTKPETLWAPEEQRAPER